MPRHKRHPLFFKEDGIPRINPKTTGKTVRVAARASDQRAYGAVGTNPHFEQEEDGSWTLVLQKLPKSVLPYRERIPVDEIEDASVFD